MVGLPRPPFTHLDRSCWHLGSGGTDPLSALIPGGWASPTVVRLRQRRMGNQSSGRFSPDGIGVLYLGFAQSTCRAECLHSWTRVILEAGNLLAPGEGVTGLFTLYRVSGLFADIRSGFDAFLQPEIHTYPLGQRLALALVSDGKVDGIVYRSVRQAGGTCVAAWPREKCRRIREGRVVRLIWDGKVLH